MSWLIWTAIAVAGAGAVALGYVALMAKLFRDGDE